MDLKGKVALVTGSSRGIGKAIVLDLASHGCDVIINYNNSLGAAEDLVNTIVNNYNVRCQCLKCDISNENDISNMVDYVINTFGKIDILVNNAAIAIDTIYDDKTKDNFMKILEINLVGTFLVSKYVGKYMLNNKYGKIINISSTNGIDTNYVEGLDYDASKAGVISLTKNLANYYAPYVNVNCVAPGWVNTDMCKDLDDEFISSENRKILLNRFAEPYEIAKVVSFLVSDDARYINGAVIRVDGGVRNV